jgi:hypothetical protein
MRSRTLAPVREAGDLAARGAQEYPPAARPARGEEDIAAFLKQDLRDAAAAFRHQVTSIAADELLRCCTQAVTPLVLRREFRAAASSLVQPKA